MESAHYGYLSELVPPDNAYRVTTSIFVPGKLWTVNRERAESWVQHRARTKGWREDTGWIALHAKLPRLVWATFHCVPFQKAGVLADPGAHIGPAKATIDGLVDAGLLPDDSGEYVSAITMAAPRRPLAGDEEGLLVLIIGRTQ